MACVLNMAEMHLLNVEMTIKLILKKQREIQ